MRLLKVLGIAASLQLLGALSAYAAPLDDKTKETDMMGGFSEMARRSSGRELSHKQALGHETETMDSSIFDSRYFSIDENDDGKWGEGKMNGEAAATQNPQPTPFAPTTKKVVQFQDMVSGFTSTMNDQVQAKIIGEQLASPLATMYITWMLTEPGVATGAASALAQSNFMLLNRYASQEAMLRQLGKEDRQAYFNCIQKKYKDDTSGAGQKQNWIAAQSECIGDYYVSKNTAGGAAITTDPDSISIDKLRWSIEHNPNLDEDQENAQKKELKLTSLLFGRKSNSTASTTTSTTQVRSEAFRADFIKYIGDIVFREKPTGSKTTTDLKGHNMQIEQERISPAMPPDKIYKERVPRYYNLMMEVMQERCNAFSSDDPAAASAASSKCQVTGEAGDLFDPECLNIDPMQKKQDGASLGGGTTTGSSGLTLDQKVQILSMPGFTFKAITIDPIFILFLAKSDDCEAYNTDTYGVNQLLEKPGHVSEEHRAVFFLARKIAIGKMLADYIKAEEVVERLNMGAVPGWVRETALAMLHDVAGTSDLQPAYQQSIAELRDYLKTMQAKTASLPPDVLTQVMGQMRNQGNYATLSPNRSDDADDTPADVSD